MLKLISNNEDRELAEKILDGEKHIDNLDLSEFVQLRKLAANLPVEHAFDLTKKAVTFLVPAYEHDEHHPYWFDNGTVFSSNIWEIKFENWETTIDFNIKLDDGKKLTAKKHLPLLNSLKKWLIIQGNPMYIGGKLLKPETIKRKLINVMRLIDALILSADKIDLAARHMEAMNSDLALDLMVRFSQGIPSGLYRFEELLMVYLLDNLSSISDEESVAFAAQHPFVAKPLSVEEADLPLSQDQRVKACAWLYKQGAYHRQYRKPTSTPKISFYQSLFFTNTLFGKTLRIRPIRMLCISEPNQDTEYLSVPVKRMDREGPTSTHTSQFLYDFKTLGAVKGEGISEISPDVFENINVKRISKHTTLTTPGRFTTLPAQIVFSAMENSFEFTLEHTDDLLKSSFDIVFNKPKWSKCDYEGYLNQYKKDECLQFVPDSLKTIGVRQLAVSSTENDCFTLRRKNVGLCDLFNVLIASIQVLVGVTMARRAGELYELHPTDCLLPRNTDPNAKTSEDVDFELIFENRKSGSGGENPERETLAKPIPRKVANLVYKLQLFNKKLIKHNLIEKNGGALFPHLNHYHLTFTRCEETS